MQGNVSVAGVKIWKEVGWPSLSVFGIHVWLFVNCFPDLVQKTFFCLEKKKKS